MASPVPVRQELDPRTLEARTQAIGQELFAAAKRQHAHLSVLNRWTAKVLSWCLSDAALKSSVLRFIDVLPSLRSPREIAQHVREYFPASAKLPAALRLGQHLAHRGLVTHGALAAIVRQLVEQVARQFIAEHRPEAAAEIVRSLAAQGATCSLDLLGEQVLTAAEADRYAAQCRTLLRECAQASGALSQPVPTASWSPQANLSIKPSALSPRFDPISPSSSIADATRRVIPLFQAASELGAAITLDMEQYELRDLTIAFAKQLLVHTDIARPGTPERAGGPRTHLGLVIQAYLRDAEALTEALLAWLAAHERTLSLRLVKGAYWDTEVAQAQAHHWPVPVHQDKAVTDQTFERLTRRLLSASPLVTTAIASHNVRSIAHAMAAAEALGLSKSQLEFQLLYGMGEALQGAIVSLGYPVRVYTPIGELIPGMAYLVRRILENTANESFLRQDFFQECSAEELLQSPTPTPHPINPPGDPGLVWGPEPLADFSKEPMRSRFAVALETVRAQLGRSYPLLVGDRALTTDEVLEVHNPAAPTQLIGRVSKAEPELAEEAIRVATEAQREWAQRPVRERATVLRQAARMLHERRDLFAAWEVFEVGKTWREADADLVEAVDYLEYYSWSMEQLAAGRTLAQAPGESNRYTYSPRGVAAVIAPWNFPVAILLGMASAALVAGNTVILKPAEASSVVAAHVARLLRDVGIPPGVVQYLAGVGEEVGAHLVRHPGVCLVLFTGSKAVGLSIVEACAQVCAGQRFVKHAVIEMGGKNAILIDADADLDAAVSGTLRSAFGYGGQKCSAASRIIVHEAVYDRLLGRLIDATDRLVIGDPADPGTDLGPLVSEAAKRRLEVARARAAEVGCLAYRYPDARLPRAGYFVGPMIVTEVPATDRLAREELFGPLVCVFRVRSFEEGLRLANDTDYALTGGVYSRSPSHLDEAMRGFEVGNLYLNRPITGAMVGRQPFGGHRLSGLGTKAGGPEYLLQMVVPKTICANTTRHGIPLD